MDIQDVMEELIVLSNVKRHFSQRAEELEQVIDLDLVLKREAAALQEKLPGGLVVWDETLQVYGIYPLDR